MLPSLSLATVSALLPLSVALRTERRSQQHDNSSDIRRDLSPNVPLRLYSVKRPIDGSWQSLSIEFSYMADFFGNLTTPNQLSYNLLENLQNVSGSPIIIRAGGSTANVAIFNASQELAVENHWNGSTNTGLEGSRSDQPSLTNIGPAWFEAFLTSPEGTRFIYDLNYRDNSTAGVASTVDVAKRVWDALGPDLLYAFEISNEMERWGGRYRSDEWGPELYTEEYLKYTDLIEEAIWGRSEDGSQAQPMFQMGTFMGSGNRSINQPWNSEVVLGLGINKKQQIRSTSQHDYHGSNCASTKEIATLRQNLLNHTNMANRAYPHQQMAPFIDETHGITYVIGETNSISCQGRDGVSNVFGTALWYLDYTLFIASNISAVGGMYFHMGTPYRYSLWAPYEGATNHSALVRPSYYGAWVLATAIGNGEWPSGHNGTETRAPTIPGSYSPYYSGDGAPKKVVHPLIAEETLTAYALYRTAPLHAIDSVVILNMEPYNSTANYTRPYVKVTLPERIQTPGVVRRLTASGSDVKDFEQTDITFAGRSVSKEGLVVGEEVTETWKPGESVLVGDAEAVLITF
ncbi:hypothetical protein J7T55_010027 [Diaporthe amygdali]|uniref:uncharacterized protein n=1 Tax=Phomopsis amygdali TaxID=1214568 RepID=UPI0022FE7AE7|nr:uncharacterized protein J7T55_010027 [Diaporthe amygdali]KAJ0116876.1 hypothetical protein J7T55_010027 [Diaporthe amygdali]